MLDRVEGFPSESGEAVKRNRGKALRVARVTITVGALLLLVAVGRLLTLSRQQYAGAYASASAKAQGGEDCAFPTYDSDGLDWEQLPAATPVMSSDGCVGYCFNAVIEAEVDEDGHAARVIILGEHGALTRGIVDRSVVAEDARVIGQEGAPVRFACFDSVDDPDGVPRFQDCVQMLASKSDELGCVAKAETTSDESSARFDSLRFGR